MTLASQAIAGCAPLSHHSAAARPAASGGNDPARTGAGAPAPAAGAANGARSGPSAAPRPGESPLQLAGQRVIYSYRGRTPPASLLSLIRHGEAAGVIFFRDNFASQAQMRMVTAELERADASPQNPVHAPLLLMTDQEGGEVRRFPGAPLESESQIGASADPSAQATVAGASAGRYLREVGLNVNLAPVLDVYRTPGNFDDQYGRSYSRQPWAVSGLGADFITAQQRAGVAATAKHFPGLGAAARTQDTDNRPVTLNLSASTIRSVDELPYRAAIMAGVRLVMVSWAVYPALDRRDPAGLSPAIVGGELRQRLHFRGVTITDGLGAGALRAFGPISRRSVLAAKAGMDLMLCAARRVAEGRQAMRGLARAYQDGQLDKSAFRASAGRVTALRASLAG